MANIEWDYDNPLWLFEDKVKRTKLEVLQGINKENKDQQVIGIHTHDVQGTGIFMPTGDQLIEMASLWLEIRKHWEDKWFTVDPKSKRIFTTSPL